MTAASVDMGTWHCMTGMPFTCALRASGSTPPKAWNQGRAFAGTVESVGSEVTDFKSGDEVYGTCDGSFAEYVRVEVGMLAAEADEPLVRSSGRRTDLRRDRTPGRQEGRRPAGGTAIAHTPVSWVGGEHVVGAGTELRMGMHGLLHEMSRERAWVAGPDPGW